ncbi:MAG: N-acyl homoserine lactonase family protein [Solirubrobacterales bacterium]
MKVADAIPLDGPLPGGVEGASVVVEPMLAGRANWPPAVFERSGWGPLATLRALGWRVPRSEWVSLPVPSFLVRHPGIGPILIDTGLHPSVASDPRHNMGRLGRRHYELEVGQDVPSQLLEKGLSAGDIGVVILTHLHADHASAISEFPQAQFVLSADEWEAATTGRRPRLHHYVRKQFDYAFEYGTVDFDSDLIDSYGPIGRTFDLFGDGTVRLAFTPGHTWGHLSVILRLPRRDFVVVGDAAYTWHQLQTGNEPYLMADEHSWHRSIRELQQYRSAYPYALIVPGHDAEFFAKLEPRYEE